MIFQKYRIQKYIQKYKIQKYIQKYRIQKYALVSPKSFCDFKDKLSRIAGVVPAVHTI